MNKKIGVSERTNKNSPKYARGSYKKKAPAKITTLDAWNIAQKVTEYAYIFQRLAKNPNEKENENITKSLIKINSILEESFSNWEDEASRVWKFQSAEELENIFIGIHDNSIFEEKTEEEVLRRVWQLISYGDISSQDLFGNNPITIQSIRNFISEMKKGPKEAARHFFDKKGGHGSESQVRKYRDDYKSGKLPDPMIQIGTPYFERKQFIVEVCCNLLGLTTEELRWMNEGIVEILKDREDS